MLKNLWIAFLTLAAGPAFAGPAAAGPTPALPPLTAGQAGVFAGLALACVDRPFPYKPEHVLTGPESNRLPASFHPVFYGCFDWHSAAHGHWLLVRLLKTYPGHPDAPAWKETLESRFNAEALKTEAGYFDLEGQKSFERPYGWAWGLRLAQELRTWESPEGRRWAERFAPLEQRLVKAYLDYLPRLSWPVRSGVHSNTAFALALALDYARAAGNRELEQLAAQRSRDYFLADHDCPVMYEPSGEDFFSPCLLQADLMRRVLGEPEYRRYIDRLLPGLRRGRLGNLERTAVVTDPTDGRLVHLDGLNLVRAWCFDGIAGALPPGDRRRRAAESLARLHAEAGLARVLSGHYEGEHWLASFAVFLLTGAGN